MGISVKKLDVEARRHSLRQNLQTFIGEDRTNVPMAAQEILNWLEFDRHGDHKYTFKILRKQDILPKAIEKSLNDFFIKKRELRYENERESKRVAHTEIHKDGKSPEYKTVTYERQLSFAEID